MQSITTLIVDDEKPSRQAIRHLLSKDSDVLVVGEAMDGEAAVDMIQNLRPKLVFLDVEMPMLSGMEVLGRVPESERPAVIFVTAYENYARGAFDLYAVDYVMKPFSDTRFATALERAKKRIVDRSLAGPEEAVRALLSYFEEAGVSSKGAAASPSQGYSRLIVKADGQLHFLNQREIRWVQAQGDYVKIHIKGQGLLVRMTMGKAAQLLDPAVFLRIRKSAIVNLAYVRRVKQTQGSNRGMELDDGTVIPIGASYREVVGELR
jgi:two-component system, LytTR family, response regulator